MSLSIRVNVTVPQEILNAASVRAAIEDVLRNETTQDLKQMFRGTVDGWKNKPDFAQKFSAGASRLAVQVYASGSGARIYGLVNAGAPSHPIPVRRARMLVFQRGYRPATSPRVLNSRAASRFGPTVRTLLIPRHPGFKAREFDEEIAEQYRPVFEKNVQEAISRAAR